MKRIFCAIFVFAAAVLLATVFVACQAASAAYVDDNGAEGTGYGSINEPTPKAPLATEAKTGKPISEEPNEAFELASDDDGGKYSCNPEDAPTVNMEPNDDLGPGYGWSNSPVASTSPGGKF